jgi:glycosyltransferase involved in cell wall biosynthesis
MPKVSICIPAYNQVVFLKNTLDSILSQSYQDYDVVITDDSTTDDVENLVGEYDFKGKLHYYRNESSLGSPQNWNAAISKAQGQYIKILHHDDWFSTTDSLAKLVQLLESGNNSLAFCGCNNLTLDGENYSHAITDSEASIIKTCPEFLFYANRIGAPSVVIFKKSDFFFDKNIKYLVDLEFYIQLLKVNNNFAYTKEALINIGIGPGQVTNIFMNNKKMLVFEYSYTFQKLNKSFRSFRWYYMAFWDLLDSLNIQSVAELEEFDWQGEIPGFIHYMIKARQYLHTRNRYKFKRIAKYIMYLPSVITVFKLRKIVAS